MNIIGGVFGLDLCKGGTFPPFINKTSKFLLNTRSSILQIINHHAPKNIWLPSFLCPSIYDCLNGQKISFYPICKNLNIRDDWFDNICKNDIVILIDFFGFKTKSSIIDTIKEKGAIIIEDASHSLLSKHNENSDYVVYSPRKFIGVPDGSILNSKKDDISLHLEECPFNWWFKSYTTCERRYLYDNKIIRDKLWFNLFKEVEKTIPIGNIKGSDYSYHIISKRTDWNKVSHKRRHNYNILLNSLSEYAIFKELPDDVVPLGFPIYAENRDSLQQSFFSKNIYPPTHWILPRCLHTYGESYELSNHILTLICDQRYGEKEMTDIINIVRNHHND